MKVHIRARSEVRLECLLFVLLRVDVDSNTLHARIQSRARAFAVDRGRVRLIKRYKRLQGWIDIWPDEPCSSKHIKPSLGDKVFDDEISDCT